MVLRDYVCLFVSLSPPKPLDQSKNVTVRTFHTWPGSVHEHIFLALGGARGPRRHVAEPGEAGRSVVTSFLLFLAYMYIIYYETCIEKNSTFET